MSELYETLHRRVEVVADWVEIGKERMGEAQSATGLSDEKLARAVPVSTRTWIRWKKRGAVPIYLLPRVAEILGLEIDRPQFDRRVVVTEADPYDDRLGRLEAQLAETQGLLARVARKLGVDQEQEAETEAAEPTDEPPLLDVPSSRVGGAGSR